MAQESIVKVPNQETRKTGKIIFFLSFFFFRQASLMLREPFMA